MTAPIKASWKTRSGALLLVASGVALTSSGAPALAKESNGNSGTIKVAFPTASTANNNDAKPGCTVRLDYYGFNRGTYNAVFTSGGKQVASGSVQVTQDRNPASAFQTSRRFTLDVSGLTAGNAGYAFRVVSTNTATGGSKSKNFTFDCQAGGATQFTGGGGGLTLAQRRAAVRHSSTSTARRTTRSSGGGGGVCCTNW